MSFMSLQLGLMSLRDMVRYSLPRWYHHRPRAADAADAMAVAHPAPASPMPRP